METNVNSRRVKSSAEGESIQKQIEDLPIIKGEGAGNSAILKGETVISNTTYRNRALSQTSMAVGAATTAGLKGWYYSAIDFTNKTITLSDKPTYILAGSTLIGGSWSSGTPNIEVNDVISLVNNSKYDLCSKVTAVNGNVITVDSLPFTGLVRDDGAAAAVIAGLFSDGYSLYIPERPDAGLIDFGGGAFSEGGQSKATNVAAHAEGFQNHAYGQFSHAEGRETKAGYAAHAEGWKTVASGEDSHSEGYQTTASGNHSHSEGHTTNASGAGAHAEGRNTIASNNGSHAEGRITESSGDSAHSEGYKTTASGSASHAEGWDNVASGTASHAEGNTTKATNNGSHSEGRLTESTGDSSHSEGYKTKATGAAAHAEGWCTTANNNFEHASGQFNKSTKSSNRAEATLFSIGMGTSDSEEGRKNALEIKQNGDIYIVGLAGVLQDYLAGVVPLPPVKIQTFGDSITDNHWGDNSSWVSFISDNISSESLTVINSAVAGAAIGLSRGSDILSQVTSGCTRSDGSDAPPLDTEADIVVVFGGTNDYSAGVPIEDVRNNLADIFEFISYYSRAKILFCTPLQRYNGADQGFNTNDEGVPINPLGKTLREYCEELISVCVRFSVPICDLNAEANLNRFNLTRYSSDGLHPNIDGDAYLSKIICKRIKELAETL